MFYVTVLESKRYLSSYAGTWEIKYNPVVPKQKRKSPRDAGKDSLTPIHINNQHEDTYFTPAN